MQDPEKNREYEERRGLMDNDAGRSDDPNNQGASPRMDPQKKKKIIIGVVVAVVVIALIVGLSVGLSGGGDNPGPGPSPGPSVSSNPYSVSSSSSDYNGKSFTLSKKPGENAAGVRETDFNKYITKVDLSVQPVTQTHFRMKMGADSNAARYTVDSEFMNPMARVLGKQVINTDYTGFFANADGSKPFFFGVKNYTTGKTLLTTEDQNFIFMDQYINVGFKIQSQHVYGLGERTAPLELGQGTWTLFANAGNYTIDTGVGGRNRFGQHPLVIAQCKSGEYVGFYWFNSNAQQVTLSYKKDGDFESVLNFVAIGGVLDLFFLNGHTMEHVINQFREIIGL